MACKINTPFDLTDSFAAMQIVNSKPLASVSADGLFKLYQRFIEKATQSEDTKSFAWMANDFLSAENCDYAWEYLDVSLPLDKIETILKKTGVLQLRSLDDYSNVLIIGCGNCPIADGGGYPLKGNEWARYRSIHTHPQAVTINPHLGFNPSLVGVFGAQEFPMLTTGQFDLIVIEGTNLVDTSLGRNELARVLSSKGDVVLNFGDQHGYAFSWSDHTQNDQLPPLVIENLNLNASFDY